MSGVIGSIIAYLENLATKVPLELFTIVGTITEEIIAPIPSPLIMTMTGSITKAQNAPLSYILFLALLGSIGKTFGSWIVYFISYKAEDLILNKFGRFFGVTKKDIEKLGKRFDGTWKDEATIAILRAIPVMSTALVSIACGILKINLKSYLLATFIGCIARNLIFLYLGYTGLAASKSVSEGLESTESVIQILLVGSIAATLIYGYIKRSKNRTK
ncbi:VTT domain-containing protein [Patescibacteria group bacterium]|nr:VTT domain-containing protein [Patescibacteria group bacterium]